MASKKKITPEHYNGAEDLAWRIKEAFNAEIHRIEKKENAYAELTVATLSLAKSMVANVLSYMLLEVDEELTDREQYFENGKQVEVH